MSVIEDLSLGGIGEMVFTVFSLFSYYLCTSYCILHPGKIDNYT